MSLGFSDVLYFSVLSYVIGVFNLCLMYVFKALFKLASQDSSDENLPAHVLKRMQALARGEWPKVGKAPTARRGCKANGKSKGKGKGKGGATQANGQDEVAQKKVPMTRKRQIDALIDVDADGEENEEPMTPAGLLIQQYRQGLMLCGHIPPPNIVSSLSHDQQY